jgi:HTH-type transcriptional regulator/antitoxin HigA
MVADMIPENDRQASLLKARLQRAEANLQNLHGWSSLKTGITPTVIQLRSKSLKETISRLKASLAHYEGFKSGEVTTFSAGRIDELPNVLKKARLARGLTQKQLADLMGAKEQQIQRYEADEYKTLSLHRLYEIADALRLNFSINASLESHAKDEATREKIVASKLPRKEMLKRGWILSQDNEAQLDDIVAEYVTQNLGENWGAFLNRQITRSNSKLNEYALLSWQARVCQLGRQRRKALGRADFFSAGLDWVEELVAYSQYEDGPRRAVEYLSNIGVIVVVEPHLEGTHLDGAATILDGDIPLIGLTLRHDRLDNFWFVLMHELGHLSLHMQAGDTVAFFDAEEETKSSGRESEADDFARTALISDEKWKSSLVRFTKSPEAVYSFARSNGISPAIVAGRIRRERESFSVFSDLVGQGNVRRQFGI